MALYRWKFVQGMEEYEFDINPNKMSTPHPRAVTEGRLASPFLEGRTSGMRGQRTPIEFTFSGVLDTQAQYDAFHYWVYDIDGRVELTTHWEHVYTVRLLQFIPNERKRSKNNPWRFEWAIKSLVYP